MQVIIINIKYIDIKIFELGIFSIKSFQIKTVSGEFSVHTELINESLKKIPKKVVIYAYSTKVNDLA